VPEVWVEGHIGESSIRFLLNSGARDLDLVLPAKLSSELGVKLGGEARVLFGGEEVKARVGEARLTIRDPETGKERTSMLEVISLPDDVLDEALLGVSGQEKLRILPDTVTGRPIFK
jgi:predicted aspartyl protease